MSKKDYAIEVNKISKQYPSSNTPLSVIKHKLFSRTDNDQFWALKDISFKVPKGEILGILGRNGAGKSTLLKILTGTIPATSGNYIVRGKIASILELGTGFHPEYTGKENVIMGGMCLGMSKKEITSKLESIIEFSELRDFIHKPFKTYSSGMQGRLTFSTAMSVTPDIFIIDEALATGDALFQEKCMNRLKQICLSGCTVILVTHSLSHIYEVCTSCILLHKSELLRHGSTKEVGALYEDILTEERRKIVSSLVINNETITTDQTNKDKDTHSLEKLDYSEPILKTNEIDLMSAEIRDINNISTTVLSIGKVYTISLIFIPKINIPRINLGFQILRETGLAVTGDTTQENGFPVCGEQNVPIKVTFSFKCNLLAGSYILRVGVTQLHDNDMFETLIDFRINSIITITGKKINGLFDPQSKINIYKFQKLKNG
jgi:ABC-type polysaccharide/polyol phosphate transport system ATPase subunit